MTPPPPRALSPRQEIIAELAAQGMRNREIAAKLFLSPRTVEVQLTGVYRKLGIKGRAELPDAKKVPAVTRNGLRGPRPRGICRGCGHSLSLRWPDGPVNSHRYRRPNGQLTAQDCSGIDQLPVGVEPE